MRLWTCLAVSPTGVAEGTKERLLDVHVLHQDVQCLGSAWCTVYPAQHW